MRVAIVYRLDRPGGVQSVAFSIIKGLNRIDIIPDILWDVEPDWSLLKKLDLCAQYKYVRFPIPTLFIDKLPDTIRYLAWIGNLIEGDQFQRQYDFFYIFYNGFLVSNGVPHLYYLSGRPLIPQLSSIAPGIAGIPIRVFRWVYKTLLWNARPVYEFHDGANYVINSQYTSGLFEEEHGIRLPVVYPPIDISGRDYGFDDLNQRDTLTFFSRFIDYKRPEMVMELACRYIDMRCVMMGGVPQHRRGYFQSLQEQAIEMGRPDIEFLANPSHTRVNQELRRTKFFVFPAVNEHFGMTTVEAIACGAIPYVHDSGGQKEIVPDTRLRFSDAEFINKFDELVHTSETELLTIRRELAKNIQKYSEENFITQMLSFINR